VGQNSVADRNEKWVSFQLPLTVARILKLTTLAPDIVEALINGEEPNGLSLAKLTQTFPEDWTEQRRQFGFATD
jgi:hypothetical protein